MKDYNNLPRHELLTLRGISAAEYLLLGSVMSEEEEKELEEKALRRLKCEPLQYIVGETDFCGFKIKVTPAVLIPRLDTEVLIERTLELVNGMGSSLRILDMCTGSGCIAIAVSALLNARCVNVKTCACDLSEDALLVAKENARLNDVEIEFLQGDLFLALPKAEDKFDVILSNPPYIPPSVIETLDAEVKDYEPLMALDGGEDGLDFYRKITEAAPKFLNRGGLLVYEIGCEQAMDVVAMMELAGFDEISVTKDLAGLDRVVSGRLR